jgi:hypothetical protein
MDVKADGRVQAAATVLAEVKMFGIAVWDGPRGTILALVLRGLLRRTWPRRQKELDWGHSTSQSWDQSSGVLAPNPKLPPSFGFLERDSRAAVLSVHSGGH